MEPIFIAGKIKIQKPHVPGIGAEEAIALRSRPGGPMAPKKKKKDDAKLKKDLKQQNFDDL